MEPETDTDEKLWNMPRNAQRRFFCALPLGRKLAIAADLAEMVRALQHCRPSPMRLAHSDALRPPATEPRLGGVVGTARSVEEVPGHRATFRSASLTSFGSCASGLRTICLTAFLSAVLTAPNWAASDTKPSKSSSEPKARVMKFVHVPEIWEEQGPRPKNVWIYGRFTARTAVSDGLFLASVNEGINWPDWEEHFNLIDNPGNYVFRRVVFQTKNPLPTLRKGTKFAIPKDHPARLVEIDRVDGVITRMVLESPPVIESQEGAGRKVAPQETSATNAPARERPRRVVPLGALAAIAKQEGVHPENLWTWGKFSARSDLREGIFTATPAGVESRRVVEWIAGAVLIYPIVEIPSRVIFYVHQPRKIRNGDEVVVSPKHPAKVKRLFLAGGLLVWLDLDPPQTSSISVRLGSSGRQPGDATPASSKPSPDFVPGASVPTVTPPTVSPVSTPTEAPAPERLATGSP
ncbi:hypothetical protein [Methylacidimicrobium tartarophylax]|uniref:Uncharacterized protein n=1 Tax=Methylacidimicrobium tartarophylax TaxID=1041768 RepID=A0A5E6MHW1_9BACT|nr:hypothetical protein [Methylacidimicrobium tartarophylax]VVM05615.1 hypothetical protein MAMT_00698 [Methylacidimicrobium tartarophylax]